MSTQLQMFSNVSVCYAVCMQLGSTDACSIDSPAGHELAPEVLPPAHLVFLGAGIPQIEDLRNLNQLPQIFFVTIAPLKLSRSSGAPTRVFAFV